MMTIFEEQILEQIRGLDEAKQVQLLNFAQFLQHGRTYTPTELMALPKPIRDYLVKQAFQQSQQEEFELFEANRESDFDDYSDT